MTSLETKVCLEAKVLFWLAKVLKGKLSASVWAFKGKGTSGCPPDTVTPYFLHWVGATADKNTQTRNPHTNRSILKRRQPMYRMHVRIHKYYSHGREI